MAVVNSCKSNNIFYNDPGALQITNQFCACSTARALLASFGDKISIDVRTGPYPQLRTGFVPKENASRKGANAVIQIPEHTLKLKKIVANFVFEVFNVKNRDELEALGDRAQKGDVDMDEYAKAVETIEFKSRDESLDLSLQCQFMKQSDLKDTTRDLEIHLWNKEFDCHTDKIRQRWMQFYKEAFCQKNPRKKSCKMKPQDLCDHYQVMKLPEYERDRFGSSVFARDFPSFLKRSRIGILQHS